MYERPALPSFTFWQRFVRLFFLLYIGWLNRDHLYLVITEMLNNFRNGYIFSIQLLNSFVVLLLWFLIFAFVYVVYIFWFAQFILPVVSLQNRLKAFWRLFLFG